MLSTETKHLELEYPYLGHRNYAHGSSMLKGMLDCARLYSSRVDSAGTIIRNFKIIRGFSSLSRAEAMPHAKAQAHPQLMDCTARLDLLVGEEYISVLLFPRDEAISRRDSEYDSRTYVSSLSVNSTDCAEGVMQNINGFIDLIRGINEVNRQATMSRINPPAIGSSLRWAYITDLPLISDEKACDVKQVTFKLLITQVVGKMRFEIKEGSFPELGSEYDHQICFAMAHTSQV